MSTTIYGSVTDHNENTCCRQGVEATIAKAMELRGALHAAAHNNNLQSPNLSAQDYPVFTPSYEDEPIALYQQNQLGNWADYTFDMANTDETILSDYRTTNASSLRKCPDEVQNLVLRAISPRLPDYSKSRRTSLGDIRTPSSRNQCKPTMITSNDSDSDSFAKNGKKLTNMVVPSTGSHSSHHPQPRNKGGALSWLFAKSLLPKKKMKNDSGMLSVEKLTKELMEVRDSRDAALVEVAGMKSSVVELSRKLEHLETHCGELKNALTQVKNSPRRVEKLTSFPKRSVDGNVRNEMPVTKEVMVEGFLQIVSEARLSVKQFCKTLLKQIEENDHALVDTLNSLLQPHKLSLNSKYSKAVSYHLESFINQSFYQDFENCVFQKNGTPKLLDPQQERQSRFQLFVSLRNLSWNEVLRKGTKYYSDEFSKFCDEKMSGIVGTLGWTRPWPEQLLQAFFVAAKCIWLVHLLAFSFDPPVGILRVDENRPFEAAYMEDVFSDKHRPHGLSRVKIMVMPGFYVHHEVLRCKVLCRYKSVV